MQEVYIIFVLVGTIIAALGFGWLVVAPFYKWAIRTRFKNNMKSR